MTDINMDQRAEKEKTAQWYVVHTYSGHENKVKANIEKMVENRGMIDEIYEVKVPMEDYVETKDGVEKLKQRKLFPGYVLIKMHVTEVTWYLVRNTRGVTGFVGPSSKPVPLSPEEVASLGVQEKMKVPSDFSEGDNIKVKSGPFESFVGIIDEVVDEKQKAKVFISMFGRETLVELNFDQIEKI